MARDGPAEYVPGVCNIGPRGRARRAAFGVASIGFGLALWWTLRSVAPPPAKLLVFLPLAAGFVAVFEAALRFCVAFSWRGVYDLR